ncbi:hypothetical protein V502_04128 [Pseudogymnoascus sp. VKM F-4520 (FW-2644)]|nr:hypothetical protein V502_04128 [Pseudogymnoascus sp. VKM F-4520 (FW-2644)]
MPSQQKNNGNRGENVPSNGGPSMGFFYATLATAPLGPTYNSMAEWEANVSRRDNPITDFLFESVAVEEPAQTEFPQKKSTQKKSTTQKKPAEKKSTQKKPKTK